MMALQVAGCALPPLLSRRRCRRRAFRSPRAVASDAAPAAAREEDGKVALGGSGVAVTKLGIGAWSWGDTTYWNEFQWDDRKLKAAKGAFDASIDCGITFFDTAEVYGAGISGAINSESLLGRFIKERQRKEQVEVAIATKFAALPWRFGRGSVICALKASLDRLGVSSVELYQLHWPGIWGNEGYLDGLGDAVEQGLVKAVGVSNYSEKRLRDAYARLKKRGIPLASNQVNYSLIYRNPEENGVKAACDELGITLIAYSPIAQGALTGKYTPDNPPKGPRGRIYTPEFLTKLQPLINRIKEIGGNYGRTPTQRRRDRINEKMRALQELVPHCNKTDKASILDEAIEYLKSLQMQVQIMWMSSGMAPMMLPGAHQLMPPMSMGLNSACMPPAAQFLSQIQRVPPFLSNPLPNQIPQISPAATSAPNVTNQVQSNRMAQPRNPFLHPNDALTSTPQLPSLFGYGPQMAQENEIQELLACTAAPALGADPPSSSDGTGT